MGQSLKTSRITIRCAQYVGNEATFPECVHSTRPVGQEGLTCFRLRPCLGLSARRNKWSPQKLQQFRKCVSVGKSVKITYDTETGLLHRIGEFQVMNE